jgi:hypothetical protein
LPALHVQVRELIMDSDGEPLFEEDIWWPTSDPSTWVSVGNYDTDTRLGRTHTQLFGMIYNIIIFILYGFTVINKHLVLTNN